MGPLREGRSTWADHSDKDGTKRRLRTRADVIFYAGLGLTGAGIILQTVASAVP